MAKFLVLLMSLFTISAHATGGVSCKIDDENLKFEFGSATSHALGSAILQAEASLDIKNQSGPINIVVPNLNQDNVAQYWNDGKQLNLYVVWTNSEGDYNAEVELQIITKENKNDPAEYSGTYTLKTLLTSPMLAEMEKEGYQPNRQVKGEVVCSIE